jgi:DNA-binding MarR family transcriptional regulator
MSQNKTICQSDFSLLRQRLMRALRHTSATGVLHSQAVARHIGVTPTDLECLDLMLMAGPVTAGQIGKRTGLTSGAVTGLIDRLERHGLVERTNDPNDRRKVVVQVREDRIGKIMSLYEPMTEAMEVLLASYDATQIGLLTEFAERAGEITMARVEDLNRKQTQSIA